ncbi:MULTISPECIES: MCP four helix bundle domain-containing protein [Pontibacter]|uniref:MCP four helix bundle domain-containing protein n=1 Tax=Pontibacter TaxID=323449 RepID=UPI00202705A2|nr:MULTISPECIES: MCP four helix bundle domain-containing protein [Pontibacter]
MSTKNQTMRWSFSFKQRHKVAVAFLSMFVIIVFANWFVSYSMEQVGRKFQSVYQDRLIPSLDISEILERYYQNRMLLEEHILADNIYSQDSLHQHINANTKAIEALMEKYETTYLVDQEQKNLTAYKSQFTKLVQVQNSILQLSTNGNKGLARKLYLTNGYTAFQNLLEPLHALIRVQGDVGQELYQSADRSVKMLKVLSYLVIGLAVIVALIVGTLLQTSRKLNNIKPQKFHLN